MSLPKGTKCQNHFNIYRKTWVEYFWRTNPLMTGKVLQSTMPQGSQFVKNGVETPWDFIICNATCIQNTFRQRFDGLKTQWLIRTQMRYITAIFKPCCSFFFTGCCLISTLVRTYCYSFWFCRKRMTWLGFHVNSASHFVSIVGLTIPVSGSCFHLPSSKSLTFFRSELFLLELFIL